MTIDLIDLRPAEAGDCDALATVHSAAWLGAYRGLLDGVELERLIARRPAAWWRSALSKGVKIQVLEVANEPAGYASYGSCRMSNLPYEGEIYELYLKPEYQGLGFGRALFQTVREALAAQKLEGLAVQVLSDNQSARAFYRALGGKLAAKSSYYSAGKPFELAVYGWPVRGKA
ncbi:GNAT family N-acetyltransferase [Roseibium polysiphoniae]|uniref:GNAT family N-acetyltransferase n=1 Tax=Roseibium polysiphoniae TaxID=2571221 RepID=A0ABR9CCX0_9HYPH|nr:GNAT family N-acetyltransferase [Roseibium polysiphoniae]MBD8877399.1 GNAT family N-acetyltransferase [Roseibium polysiphoniae]